VYVDQLNLNLLIFDERFGVGEDDKIELKVFDRINVVISVTESFPMSLTGTIMASEEELEEFERIRES